ncbi:hypothetical protein [Actinokineospora enzanensis]|uniref:hypothetical protein n=1 Tax=Actinokineospora enzanensis TaxID=155975 RepID=UPI00035E64E8|nr:hypothetical protein [Actinokineospora enzanensis]
MANWPQLNPVEQQGLLFEITEELVAVLPSGWLRLQVEIAKLGNSNRLRVGLRMEDGSSGGFDLPESVWKKFLKLRTGMYADDIGTWVECKYIVDAPAKFQINYNRDHEPDFATPPAPKDYETEFKWFPRSPENTPEWFRRGLDGAAQGGA